ncbi:MAG: hypothetical protein ACT4QC_21130 [Planctomycetaceae bacterium]
MLQPAQEGTLDRASTLRRASRRFARWANDRSRVAMLVSLALCAALLTRRETIALAAETQRVVTVARCDGPRDFVVEEGVARFVPEGRRGQTVARFDDEFSLRIDLAPRKVQLADFDLLKLEVAADAHAFLKISLENYPRAGELSHWYVLDGARTDVAWKTIWVDLNRPEEIQPAGSYKGLSDANPDSRAIRITGHVTDIHRALQGPGRSIRLGDIRFVKKTIDLDWDQARAPSSWGPGGDLVFRYPLTVANRSEKAITAAVRLQPVQVEHARGDLSHEELPLAAGETRSIEAVLTLPASFAAAAPPLYCERFEAIAEAADLADSDVTILRSSDVIPLSVTVPIAEARLQFPLLPRVKEMPEAITGFNAKARQQAVSLTRQVTPDDLNAALDGPLRIAFNDRRGFNYWGMEKQTWHQAGWRYLEGLTACEFLYDVTGEKTYLERGTTLLLRGAELFPARQREWRDARNAPISHGVYSANTLGLGWATGSMRAPYSYQRHGLFNDFDLLAKDMEPAARDQIVSDLIVPAAIQMRNHYFGLGNQQDVVNYAVLYAGLAARNWPLVSHVYDSPHGLLNQIRFNFDDEGMAGEGNYHQPALEPILCACELLLPRGIDLYDQRLFTMLHSRAAAAIKKEYRGPMLAWTEQHRFAGKAIESPASTDGLHLATGVTLLRWKGREVSMNWGAQLNRNAPDRCSLRINDLGGGNYTSSSLGQSIIIVDEERQYPAAARVVGYDVDGPVQWVCATSDRHYPGSRITRTFALLTDGALVIDRVVSDTPRTVDWCLKGAGERLSLETREVAGGFTGKPDDKAGGVIFGARLKFDKHFVATTDLAWTEGGGRLMMAAEPGTKVYRFHVEAPFSGGSTRQQGVPVLMVRRGPARQADFIAFFSGQAKGVERLPVVRSDGSAADALGAKLTLKNGRTIRAIVNDQPGTEVRVDGLATRELFATDDEGTPREKRN